MPFKGDTRLGGRRNNAANLNGTSSEFNSFPLVGTVLSGPTDTSRYVNDFLGTPFYMPYSTTVYADGLGGQTSVETWGLQYLPAGWVTATAQFPQYLSWYYETQYEELDTEGDNFEWGYQNVNYIEDGTGINYTSVISTTTTAIEGMTLASSDNGTGADRYRVLFNSAEVGLTSFQDFTMHPAYGTGLGNSGGNLTYVAPCQTFNIGTYSAPLTADGYGGSISGSQSNTYNSASYLGPCGDQNNGWLFYHHDGNGNVSTGNAPSGFTLLSSSWDNSFQWSAPDGSSGTFVYETCGSATIADGNGGSYVNSNCSGAPQGHVFQNGSYSYQTGNNEEGDPIYETQYYNLSYNGYGGYNTNYP